jgi:hypothetical protein
MNTTQSISHFNVYIVEEFDAPTKEDRNHKAKSWTKVGAAFPHKEGLGFNIELKALPVSGRLVALPSNPDETSEASAARDSRARR